MARLSLRPQSGLQSGLPTSPVSQFRHQREEREEHSVGGQLFSAIHSPSLKHFA